MLLTKMVKGLNEKLGLKLVMVMAEVGGDIVSGYGRSIGKGIKGGFNIRFGDSVNWYIGRVIGSGVNIDVDNEVVSGDNGGVKL